MKSPSLRQLKYFIALTECGHFGRAADRCFVSQSAFSSAIKELEITLDAQLVDRTNRNVTITALGQQVAVQARLVLRDLESLVETARGQKEPLTGELRLGVIPTIAPFMLPEVLPELRKQYPDLRLLLVEDQTQRIHARLMQGELDVLLVALPWAMQGVEELLLFRDAFCLACHEDTEHVEPENYRFSRLDSDSILLLEDGHCLREHALAACRIRNTQKVSQFAASSLLTLIEMVDADLGVTFLPEMARGSSLLRNTGVKLYSLGERSYRTIGLVWRKGSRRVEEFRLLGDFFRDSR
ncbi:MAG: hydrogen peroxide-inducible genes activator [Gammaproteobacteria bacterium]|nr:hydrogen peroxide-inducible genes activator [Gammaproteobacteria bacterium]MDH3362858.1 hydrogen peroxide-inducible genes activator [Gammaproteobacteria bacterium]